MDPDGVEAEPAAAGSSHREIAASKTPRGAHGRPDAEGAAGDRSPGAGGLARGPDRGRGQGGGGGRVLVPGPGIDHTLALWFDPAELYQDGFRTGITTALRLFPGLAKEVRRWIAWVGPRVAIEVGPGDRPLLEGVAVPVFLELSPRFLRGLSGHRVQGDLLAAPFRPGAADLVIAADVFTHLSPAVRPRALSALQALAPRLLIFNNEGGTPQIDDSRVPPEILCRQLEEDGYHVHLSAFAIPSPSGIPMRMQLISAVAPGVSPRVGAA